MGVCLYVNWFVSLMFLRVLNCEESDNLKNEVTFVTVLIIKIIDLPFLHVLMYEEPESPKSK